MNKQDNCFTYWEAVHTFVKEMPATKLPHALQTHVVECVSCKTKLVAWYLLANPQQVTIDTTGEHDLEDIDAYVELEQENVVQAIQLYPHVWLHLTTCSDCYEYYSMLQSVLIEMSSLPSLSAHNKNDVFLEVYKDSSNLFTSVLQSPDNVHRSPRNMHATEEKLVILDRFPSRVGNHDISITVQPQTDVQPWNLCIKMQPSVEGDLLIRLNQLALIVHLVDGVGCVLMDQAELFNTEGVFEVFLVQSA